MAKTSKKSDSSVLKNQLPLFSAEILHGPTGPDRLLAIGEQIRSCHECGLCMSRTNPICGQGSAESPVLAIVAGAPGTMEDLSGAAITGRPGMVLDEILSWMELPRAKQFLCHVVACKPPQYEINRDQVAACRPLLYAQLRAVKPQYIITFGEHAYRSVFYEPKKTDVQVQSSYGIWKTFDGSVPAMGTHSLESMLGKGFKAKKLEAHEHLRRVTRKLRDVGILKPKEADV